MRALPGAGPISEPARKRRPRHVAGFLLIEVLVALMIAAIALSALVRFQVELYRAGALASQRADALMIASGQMESLQAGVRAGMLTPSGGTDSVQTAPDAEPLSSGAVYVREWSLTAADGILLIDVMVRWDGADSRDHVVALSSAAQPHAALAAGVVAAKPDFIGLP